MKISSIISVILIAVTTLTACSKDNDDKKPATVNIEGRWIGTYKNDASGNTFYYSFNIKQGGVIEEVNSSNQKIGEGTWKLEHDILTASYIWPGGSKYSIIAAFNKNQGKLLGDWGYGNSATNGGTWEMTKSN